MNEDPVAGAAPRARPKFWTALSRRDFRLVFSAQSVSTLGDAAYATVLAFFVYTFAGFSGAVGLVLGVVSLSTLVSLLLGGAVADRVNRKWIAVSSDLVRFVAVGTLGVLTATGTLTLPLLVVLTGVAGLADGLFEPALRGSIPDTVPPEMLTSANGLLGFVASTGVVIGAALGGVLYATLGPAMVFLLNSVSFAVSGIILALVSGSGKNRAETRPSAPGDGFFTSVRTGIAYLSRVPVLLSIPVAALALLVADAPTSVLTPELIAQRFSGDAGTIGWMNALLGCGAALGALVIAQFGGGRRPAILIFGAWGAAHLVTAVIFAQTSAAVAIVLSFLRGALSGVGGTLWNSLLMRNVDPRMLSRVFSLDTLGSSALLPIGVAATGLAVGSWPAVVIVVAGQVIGGLLMLALLVRRAVRTA